MIICVCFEYFYAIIGKLLKQCLELSRKLNLELLSKYFESLKKKKGKYLEILKTIFGIIEKRFGVIEKIFGAIGKYLEHISND